VPDVSSRVLGVYLEMARRHGFSADGLFADIQAVRDGREWFDWSDFCVLNRRLAQRCGEAGLEEAGTVVTEQAPVGPIVRVLASGLALSTIFKLSHRYGGPSVFRRVRTTWNEASPARLELGISLADGQEDSPEFFLIVLGFLKALPTIVGGTPVPVRMVRSPRSATYFVDVPVRVPLTRRLWLAVRVLRSGEHLDDLHHALLAQTTELRDTAARLRQEAREREKVEVQLRHAQKLEAVGQLASGIAHEINNPLQFLDSSVFLIDESAEQLRRAVAAYREAAGDRAPPIDAEWDVEGAFEQLEESIDTARSGLDRVTRIVRSMGRFSWQGDGKACDADINACVRDTIEVSRNRLKPFATVETDLGDLPLVSCRQHDINQVLLILLINAAQAVELRPGGTRGAIVVRTRAQPGSVTISVLDNGTGIPEAARARIFDPFFTTKPVGVGTGQGLSIAHAIIVEHHGGHIGFDTSPAGTRFDIVLPLGPSSGEVP